MDLDVTRALVIPAAELEWRFSRSSGPGGQHVNTSDSRVQLTWSVVASAAPTDAQRERLLARVGDSVTVTASEERSQLQNRKSARAKLVAIVSAALAPDGPKRRATRPTKGSQLRRLATKTARGATKANRRRPAAD